MRMVRASGRVASVALVAVIAVSSLAGCSFGTTPEIEAILVAIEGELAKLPNVVEVDVEYENSLNLPGDAYVTFKASSESGSEALVDEAVRLIWQSKINPLEGMVVKVYDESKTRIFASNNLRLYPEDEAELIAKYGPHPQSE